MAKRERGADSGRLGERIRVIYITYSSVDKPESYVISPASLFEHSKEM